MPCAILRLSGARIIAPAGDWKMLLSEWQRLGESKEVVSFPINKRSFFIRFVLICFVVIGVISWIVSLGERLKNDPRNDTNGHETPLHNGECLKERENGNNTFLQPAA